MRLISYKNSKFLHIKSIHKSLPAQRPNLKI